jgi:hypothetical protein
MGVRQLLIEVTGRIVEEADAPNSSAIAYQGGQIAKLSAEKNNLIS